MRRSRWSRAWGYLKSSLWVSPLIAIPFAMIATADIALARRLRSHGTSPGLGVTGARALLDAVITSSL